VPVLLGPDIFRVFETGDGFNMTAGTDVEVVNIEGELAVGNSTGHKLHTKR